MKLLVRISERIEIVYITIVFVSVLVCFVIAAILAHITWVLSIRTAKTVTVDREIFVVKIFMDNLFQRKLNTRNILCNVPRPIPILVAKVW